MQFPILEDLKKSYTSHASLLDQFVVLFNQKLWHELTQSILRFIFSPDVKGKLSLDFYTQFAKKFSRNIDQINHLKIIKESLSNVEPEEAINFLENFENKEAFTDESKVIAKALRASLYAKSKNNLDICSRFYHEIDQYLKEHKEVDTFVYSSFYRFSMMYFEEKKKQKLYYDYALQFLAYTPPQEIDEKEKISVLASMAIALLVSDKIYNFSELMEQPMLKYLEESEYRWIYELLVIFNKGDIEIYDSVIDNAVSRNELLKSKRTALDQKIRLMAFLETAFNLPKNNRVLSFSDLSGICSIPAEHVQFMVMKAASLDLVKIQINQISSKVTITWVKPKVLSNERIGVMLKKFSEWEEGVESIRKYIIENRKNVV